MYTYIRSNPWIALVYLQGSTQTPRKLPRTSRGTKQPSRMLCRPPRLHKNSSWTPIARTKTKKSEQYQKQ